MEDGSTKDITSDVNTKYASGTTTIATVNNAGSISVPLTAEVGRRSIITVS